jgi:predicted DNA-binding protein (MmcQ/YjbR family)
MVTNVTAIKLALAFDEADEKPHFEKKSFRVRKKIFATLDARKRQMVVRLSEVDQSVFTAYNSSVIYPVTGGWGKQGWTIIELKNVRKSLLEDALTTSYCNVAPKKLAEKYFPKNLP